MIKYRNIPPNEISKSGLIKLVADIKGFVDQGEPSEVHVIAVLNLWGQEYNEQLDKVMFDNLSAYEP